MRPAEFTLAELAADWQLPIELVDAARRIVGGWPVRRTAAGVPVFGRETVSRMHRLLIEKDATVLFEPRNRRAEFAAYFERETGRKLIVLPLPPEDLTGEETLG
jgi:hypothetical protein